jgi:Flp pilus assembly protein TadG
MGQFDAGVSARSKSMDKRHTHRGESGQTLVLLALWMISLLAILALVLDGGHIYLERRHMQNAADAGATAGTRTLALGGTTGAAQAAASQYAVTYNGADNATVTINGKTVTVVACENVPMTFARVLGLNSVVVCATASATYGAVSEVVGLAPIAIKDFPYLFDTPYVIWDDDKDRDPTTGYISGSFRGWLNLPCVYPMDCGAAGADDLKNWMHNGYPSKVKVKQWIRGDGGVKAAVIQQAYVGQELRMVVYDQIEDKYNNESYYHVIKFVIFKVTEVIASGNPKGVRGYFMHYFTPGPPGDGEDSGWNSLDLTQ